MLLAFIRLALLGTSLHLTFGKISWLLAMLVVVQGFTALDYSSFGFPVNAAEFTSILMCTLIFYKIINSRTSISSRAFLIFSVLSAANVLSIFYGAVFLEKIDTKVLGFFQQPMVRYLSTLLISLSLFSLLFLPALFSKTERWSIPHLVIVTTIFATTFQCFIGFYDFIAARSAFPVIPTYQFTTGGFDALRSKGLVGEPRHLASFVVTGLAILLYARFISHRPVGFLFSTLNLLLHLCVLLMTQSTSGISLFIIIAVLLYGASIFRTGSTGRLKLLIAFIFGVPITFAVAGFWFQDFIQARLTERLTIETVLRSEFNAAGALEFARENPSAVLIGTGSGVSAYLVRDTQAFRDFVSVITTRETAIRPPPVLFRTVLEGGLLALSVKLYFLILSIKGLFWKDGGYLNLVAAYMIANFIFSVVAGNAGAGFLVPGFWISAGLLVYFRSRACRLKYSACASQQHFSLPRITLRKI